LLFVVPTDDPLKSYCYPLAGRSNLFSLFNSRTLSRNVIILFANMFSNLMTCVLRHAVCESIYFCILHGGTFVWFIFACNGGLDGGQNILDVATLRDKNVKYTITSFRNEMWDRKLYRTEYRPMYMEYNNIMHVVANIYISERKLGTRRGHSLYFIMNCVLFGISKVLYSAVFLSALCFVSYPYCIAPLFPLYRYSVRPYCCAQRQFRTRIFIKEKCLNTNLINIFLCRILSAEIFRRIRNQIAIIMT